MTTARSDGRQKKAPISRAMARALYLYRREIKSMVRVTIFVSAILGALSLSACTKTEAYSPDKLQQQYGINGAYYDTVSTADGSLRSTVVPVTLADGRSAQLIIPVERRN